MKRSLLIIAAASVSMFACRKNDNSTTATTAVTSKEVITDFDQYFKDMKLAAQDNSQKDALISKYKDWASIPLFMSPKATMKAFKKEMK